MELNLKYFLISQNISGDLKGQKVKYKLQYGRCFLGLPHGTTPAAVTTNKNIKMSSFKSSGNIQKKDDGPYRSVSDNQSSSVTLNELAMKAINLNGVQITKSNRKAMNRNWSNQTANPALKTKAGNKQMLQIDKIQ